MGWFSGLFAADKAAEGIFDKDKGFLARVTTGVGKMVLTDEEVRDLTIKRIEAMHPFKIMQRIMVTIIMVEWAILFNAMLLAIAFKSKVVFDALFSFAQTEFAWVPIAGAVSTYLLGGVWPSKEGK